MAAAQLRLDSISDVLISDLLAAQRLPSNLRVPLGALKTGIRTAFVKARKEKVMTFRKKMERGFTLIDLVAVCTVVYVIRLAVQHLS